MNVELLQKVKDHILAEPAKFDVNLFECNHPCGTTRCIGGWAHFLHNPTDPIAGPHFHPDTREFIYPGQYALGLTSTEAERLFMITDWPEEFRSYPEDDDGYAGESYATPEQAAARIDHFIATEGRE